MSDIHTHAHIHTWRFGLWRDYMVAAARVSDGFIMKIVTLPSPFTPSPFGLTSLHSPFPPVHPLPPFLCLISLSSFLRQYTSSK